MTKTFLDDPIDIALADLIGRLVAEIVDQIGTKRPVAAAMADHRIALRPGYLFGLYITDELEELTLDRLAAVAGMPYEQVLTSRLSAAELRHYARCRGYRPGWVYYRFLDQQNAAV